jgi:hypothetical protein
VIDFLRQPGRFNSGEFARIVDLPGITRAVKSP